MLFPFSRRNAGNRAVAGMAARSGLLVLFLIALAAGMSSCSSRDGWGVVLWTVQGTGVKSGTIVPIYLKSNIGKVYVIGMPEADGGGKKEVPFWQIEQFRSKRAARQRVKEFGEYASVYMVAARDGLPIREKPDNDTTTKRVFRLREGQAVKVLAKVEGAPVSTGGKVLEGDWYLVLADDGTRGYVFSFTMRMYDETTGEKPLISGETVLSAGIDVIFSRSWRPSWYQTMTDEDRIDPDLFSFRYGLFTDAVNRQVRVELPAFSKVFQYSAITEEGGWYFFTGTPLKLRLEGVSALTALWADTEAPAADTVWKRGDSSARFVLINIDIQEVLRKEEARSAEALKAFFASAAKVRGTEGTIPPSLDFSSPETGTIELGAAGAFAWSGGDSLPAGFAPSSPEGAARKGTARFGLHLDAAMSRTWQGGFSVIPEEGDEGRYDYVYRLSQEGLFLARTVVPPIGEAVAEIDQRLGVHLFAFASL
ncbi:MAG: SH3 domain-containing protein [Rectinema sp.]